ncbi:MAG: putative inner membrane transporter YicL [Candidatus Dichloromethanomonas elyunquensis]|nr:MAG: putative inner membrane transporter YicL [Candidatus Dichloromethanomonas elyunquensis]
MSLCCCMNEKDIKMHKKKIKEQKNLNIQAYFTLVLVSMLYGGNIISARVISSQIPTVSLSFIRGLLGLIIVVPFAWRQVLDTGKPSSRELFNFALLGFLGMSLPYTLLVWGMKYSTAANASIILATGPAITITLLAIGWRVKPSSRQVLGIIVSFLGLLLVFTRGSLNYLLSLNVNAGDFILLINITSSSLFNILGQGVMKKFSPLVTAAYSLIFGTLILIPYAGWELNTVSWHLSWMNWLVVFYMGFMVTGNAFLLNLRGVNQIGSGKAAIFINLTPVFGILFGVVLLNESLYLYHWIGIILVLTGIFLSLSEKRQRKNSSTENSYRAS